MLKNASHRMHGSLTESTVSAAGKQRLIFLKQGQVHVQPGAIVIPDWLGHERRHFALPNGKVSSKILQPKQMISTFKWSVRTQFDATLSTGGSRSLLTLNADPALLKSKHQFSS